MKSFPSLLPALKKLESGIKAKEGLLHSKSRKAKRSDEKNLEVFLGKKRVFSVKVFLGRQPYYFPWAELFTIDPSFFGTDAETKFVKLFSKSGPGTRLFVEYGHDEKTQYALLHGVPPAATRMGNILFKSGFTWFKDWYFPEGFYEGDIKLQAEVPIDGAARKRHIEESRARLKKFIKTKLAKRYPGEAGLAKELLDN